LEIDISVIPAICRAIHLVFDMLSIFIAFCGLNCAFTRWIFSGL